MRLIALVLCASVAFGQDPPDPESGLTEATRRLRRKLLPVVENRTTRLFAREWAPSEALRMGEEDCKILPVLLKSMVEFFGRSGLDKLPLEAMEREERLLEFCLVLAAANPKSAHAAAVDFAARNLGLQFELLKSLAFDILGRTEPGIKLLQGYLRAKEDWFQAEAHRVALDRVKEVWAKQAVEALLKRDVKELGPRMNNVFLRARTLMAATEEYSKLDSIDAKVRRLVPRGLAQLYSFDNDSFRPRRDPSASWVRERFRELVAEDRVKLFEVVRAAVSTEPEPFADVAALWLWEFGAELTEGEEAALRRRGIPFDQKLKLR